MNKMKRMGSTGVYKGYKQARIVCTTNNTKSERLKESLRGVVGEEQIRGSFDWYPSCWRKGLFRARLIGIQVV